jgi:hypothetical protein
MRVVTTVVMTVGTYLTLEVHRPAGQHENALLPQRTSPAGQSIGGGKISGESVLFVLFV